MNSLNPNCKQNKSTSTLYKKMKESPESWLLIPLGAIPTKIRHNNRKIEDRWWNIFYPNTLNDQPPNGTLWNNNSTSRLDHEIQSKMNNMNFQVWTTKISKKHIGLSILELIAGMNKFSKYMKKPQLVRTLQLIRKKCLQANMKNLRGKWNCRIPLQTKNKVYKLKQCIRHTIKLLNCPASVKTFISNNLNLYFKPTRKIIDLIRMDRDACESVTANILKNSTLKNPLPCQCQSRTHSIQNELNHTFIRTDDPQHLAHLLNDHPEVKEFEHILKSSSKDRVKLNTTTAHIDTKRQIRNFLKSLPGSKGKGRQFAKQIWNILDYDNETHCTGTPGAKCRSHIA